MRAPPGNGGRTGVPAEAADHWEAGPQGCADLSLRPPLRGEDKKRRQVAGQAGGGGLGCRELWEESQAGQNAALRRGVGVGRRGCELGVRKI